MLRTITLLTMLCVWAGAAAQALPRADCVARSGSTIVPLVELYTSEGCSSCPPADRWLTRRFRDGGANYLAFHVDYWDDIGWPDRFASPDFTRRQRARVSAAGDRTVYTPQVMLDEQVRANWHDDRAWAASLQRARQPARAVLALRLQPSGDGWLAVVGAAPSGPATADAEVWIARYVDGQSTAVRAGENRGAVLHHDRVVRGISGPWPLKSGTRTWQVRFPAESSPWGVTAFVQDGRGKVLQSLDLHASGCIAPVAAR